MVPVNNYHRDASPNRRSIGGGVETVRATMNARFRHTAIDILVLIELPKGSYRRFGGPTHV